MMNKGIRSVSKIYLIMLISIFSLLVTSNILVFSEDTQQQHVIIDSDVKLTSFFSFFENFKNATESPIVIINGNAAENPIIYPQNNALSQETRLLKTLDIPELKENLKDIKKSLANADVKEALTITTDLQNQFLLLPNKTKLTGDFQKIKESLSQKDLAKALDDITDIQKEIIKAETEVFKAQLSNDRSFNDRDTEDERDDN